MLPCKIRITNIGPYENLELDLEAIRGPLIAVVGSNGSGKTFLLENLIAALYRGFPTRPAGIYRYCTARHGAIEMEWLLGGHRYTSVLKIDSQTQKMEAVLKQHGVDRPLNDGKVSTYDTVIEKLLGSYRQTLISSFAAQDNSGSFLEIPKSERKSLFIQMLGLERLQSISVAAGKAADAVSQKLSVMSGKRQSLEEAAGVTVPDIAEIQIRIDDILAHIEFVNASIESTQKTINGLESVVLMKNDIYSRHDSLTAKRSGLLERIVQLQAAIAKDSDMSAQHDLISAKLLSKQDLLTSTQDSLPLLQERIAKLNSAASRLQQLTAQKVALQERYDSSAMELCKISASLQQSTALADRLPELVGARDQLALLEQKKESRQQHIDRLRTDLSGLQKTSRESAGKIRDLQSKLHQHQLSEKDMRRRLETAVTDSAILTTVPCKGEGEYSTCAFLTRAIEASQNFDELQSNVDTAMACGLAVKKEIDSIPSVTETSIRDLESSISQETTEIKRIDEYIAARKRDLDTLGQAELASQKVDLMRQQKDTIQQNMAIIDVDLDSVNASIKECGTAADELRLLADERIKIQFECSGLRDEIAGLQERLNLAIAARGRIDAQMAALAGHIEDNNNIAGDIEAVIKEMDKVREASDACKKLEDQIANLKIDLRAKTTELQKEQETLFGAKTSLENKRIAQETLERLDQEYLPLQHEMASYKHIHKAFGPMEIQSYEIDAAGPAISTIANDLLFTCFGPRFSLRFVTRVPLSDGTGFKDAFDIVVIDQDAGREGSIDDLSGGQKVICGESVRLAIALYNRQRNNISWDALFRDEASSALDDINAPHYIAMLKAAREIGHFEKVYFVSHQGRVQEIADNRIRVHDGTATVEA